MAITIDKIIEKVRDKEKTEFNELYMQMDEDYDLWNLKPRVFDAHERCINITSNEPRTYADSIKSQIVSAPRQITVKIPDPMGEIAEKELANDLERFYDFILKKADLRLRRLLQPPLMDSLTWYALIRGETALRVLLYKIKDKIIIQEKIKHSMP